MSFVKPESVKFRYKLDGLNADWVEAGTRRTAYYSYLPPGHYVFQVIAANSDGVWNTVGVSVKIVREGRDKGQGIAYLPDGTMIIVNHGLAHLGKQVDAEVQSTLQTGAGVIIFAEAKPATMTA